MWSRLSQSTFYVTKRFTTGIAHNFTSVKTIVRARFVATAITTVVAQPAADSSSSFTTAAATVTDSDSDAVIPLESAEDAECPWCEAMRAGPCANEFTRWRNCMKAIQAEEQKEQAAAAAAASASSSAPSSSPPPSRATRQCMPLFQLMDSCVRTPGPKRNYYSQILPLDEREPSASEKIQDAE